jgi:hypothetical protein
MRLAGCLGRRLAEPVEQVNEPERKAAQANVGSAALALFVRKGSCWDG